MSAERDVRSAIGGRMADGAAALLDSFDAGQRAAASWPFPSDAERRSWFYTPTDHGGLALSDMAAGQQQLAHQLVATGLSAAGYNTVAAIMGLENILDRTEGWTAGFGRERGRDPGLYWIAIFGEPATPAWGWRFGGHHVSLNYTIVDGAVAASTPSFLGADPAATPLLGAHLHRPLAAAEDLGRELLHLLSPIQRDKALISPTAPVDLVTANRPELSEGDGTIDLPFVFRGRLPQPFDDLMASAQLAADAKAAMAPADVAAVRFSFDPKGVSVSDFDQSQTEALRALLDVYLDRLPDELADLEKAKLSDSFVQRLSFAWAGGTAVGEPHYYRLQSDALLVEYDNTQRDVNHVHTVWRDLTNDFGVDVLGQHYRAQPHRH